jgi:hypothetical protein
MPDTDALQFCSSKAADHKCSQQKPEDFVGERMAGKFERKESFE